MKIISGKYKGRNLLGHDLEGTRPTMDRVKESLFAMIQDYLEGSIVLDLFSGSGNLGIEALSNNAKKSYLVDNNKKAVQVINQNINNIGINNVKVLNMDYKKALSLFNKKKKKFNIIFLDPPYDTDFIELSIELIDKYNLLEDNGIIVCESNNINKMIYPKEYKVVKSKKYGDKYIEIITDLLDKG